MPGKGGKTTPDKSEKSKEPTQPPVQEDTAEDEERTIWIQNFLKNVGIIPGSSITDDIHNTLEVVLVDPASLKFVTKVCPKNAGGASGAIYRWLGINKSKQFCTNVDDAFKTIGDVVGITVPDKQKAVIHAIGPGFRDREISEDQAVEELIKVYQNVLDLFAKSQQKCLMLVPICGGIQAGKLRSKMGDITLRALGEAFAELEETVLADKHHGAHVRTA